MPRSGPGCRSPLGWRPGHAVRGFVSSAARWPARSPRSVRASRTGRWATGWPEPPGRRWAATRSTSVSAIGLARVPAELSLTDAVAVAEGGLTALPFLRDHAKVRPGQRVLVNGASGSVGTAAVQLAKHLGAHVTGVCSAANAELVRSLGADEVIDYATGDFASAANAYDVVLDAVGTRSYRECRAALRPGGIYLTTVPDVAILFQGLWTRWVGSTRAGIAFTGLRRPECRAEDLAGILGLAEQGTLRPVIDHVCSLGQVPQAHGHVDTGRKRGAVVASM